MNKTEYWAEGLSNAFEDAKALDAWKSLDTNQQASIAEAMESYHDNYWMAFYSPPASDHMMNERRQLEDQIKRLRAESESWKRAFTQNVANRWGVDTSSVTIHKDGSAQIL